MEQSKFKFISIGQVVKDKKEDDIYIEVYLTEMMPSIDGDYNQPDKFSVSNVSNTGKHYKDNISRAKTITAKWRNLYNSNRITAPDVVVGEMVDIYQYAGSDEYWWCSNGLNLRKKEKVLYYYSNKEKSDTMGKNGDQGYFFLVDTRNKQIVLHTADNDKEASKYDFIINTKDGEITIRDKQNNYIHLESVPEQGLMSISINDKIQYNTKHNVMNASEDVTINTKNYSINNESHVVNSSQDFTINVPKFAVCGNGDELIQILMDFVQESIDEMHVGNLGIPTAITGASRAKLMQIKSRLSKFKHGGKNTPGLQYAAPVEKSQMM